MGVVFREVHPEDTPEDSLTAGVGMRLAVDLQWVKWWEWVLLTDSVNQEFVVLSHVHTHTNTHTHTRRHVHTHTHIYINSRWVCACRFSW